MSELAGARGGARGRRSIAAVVPTAGASPLLGRCLEALRAEGLETVVVHQGGGEPPADAVRLADRLLPLPENLGFAAATNLGVAATAGEYVATVNDDAVVEPGWASALAAALDAHPGAAAVQGTNLQLDDPNRIDGRGLGWNRWWQAVQVGHGETVAGRPAAAAIAAAEGGVAPAVTSIAGAGAEPAAWTAGAAAASEVFGVSATAALYRRAALDETALRPGEVFDSRLGAYYEDVDLACRLRRAGWRALWVPAARTLHAGSLTGGRRRRWRLSRLYGNRWAVVARCLGRSFPAAVPRMAARDLADLARALGRADLVAAAGIAGGWGRALALLPGSLHRGHRLAR